MNPHFASIESFAHFQNSVTVIIGLVCIAFWAWMLIDAVTEESSRNNDRAVWVLVVLFGNFLGVLIYLFYRRPQRKRLKGQNDTPASRFI